MISPTATQLLERVGAWSLRDWLIVVAALSIAVAVALFVRTLMRALRGIETLQRRIHKQQENIIGMLLKAGFRPANTLDWGDNGDATRVLGEPVMTQFDWRKPE